MPDTHKHPIIADGPDPVRAAANRWRLAPPAARVLQRRTYIIPIVAFLVVTGGCAALAALTVLLGPSAPSVTSGQWFAIGFAAAIMIAIGLCALLTHRLKRFEDRVRANSCEHCLQCGYSLHALPVVYTCPECGTAYDIEEVRRKWKEFFAADQSYVLR